MRITGPAALLDVAKQFPILSHQPDLVYLDSAATTQKPAVVLDAVNEYLRSSNANAGRGSYSWADTTTALIESTRQRVSEFLGDHSNSGSVTFTSGTSEALRDVAAWLATELTDGDEIIVPDRDHSANWYAWSDLIRTMRQRGVGVALRTIPYTADGDYNLHELSQLVSPRTKLVAVTHIHHVYGVNMDPAAVRDAIGDAPLLCVDGAQSFGHAAIPIIDSDVDFLAFSGHKAMALTGVGGVWAANRRCAPFEKYGWQGTPNVVGIVSLAASLNWFAQVGVEGISSHIAELTSNLEQSLARLPGVELVGRPVASKPGDGGNRRHGIVSFQLAGCDTHAVGEYLDSVGIMVRADSHCQANALESGSIRASIHAYNTESDINRLIAALRTIPRV